MGLGVWFRFDYRLLLGSVWLVGLTFVCYYDCCWVVVGMFGCLVVLGWLMICICGLYLVFVSGWVFGFWVWDTD